MGFRLRRKEPIEEGVRRIAREEIDRALSVIANQELAPQFVVHEARKHCKKLRGLLRIVEPAMGSLFEPESDALAAAARGLATTRDADVAPLTLERLGALYPGNLSVEDRSRLQQSLRIERPGPAEQGESLDARLEHFAEQLQAARQRIAEWPLADTGFDDLADGLAKTYRRSRRTMRAAYDDPIPERFHEWRKHAKYHGYHMRLLAGLWKQEMQVRRSAGEILADLLGDHHDLTVLRGMLLQKEAEEDAECKAAAISLIDRRRVELEKTVYPLGMRLFAEKPGQLIRRFRKYWRVWRKK
jgi:CHAD domain-containing protein